MANQTQNITVLKYPEIEEVKSAVEWLRKNKDYLFNHNNPNFWNFDNVLEWLKFSFEERVFLRGEEVDMMGDPKEHFEIVHINQERYQQRGKKTNTALQVHELTERYLLCAGIEIHAEPAHIFAEYVEHEFRQKMGLSPCSSALPQEMIPKLKQFESEFRQKIKTMGRYEFGKLLFEYVDY